MSEQTEVAQPQAAGGARRTSGWRMAFRIVAVLYLVTLPACTQKAGHFGPGFFPLLAALFLVPVFAMATAFDAIAAWSEEKASRAAAVLMSMTAADYTGIVVFVMIYKLR